MSGPVSWAERVAEAARRSREAERALVEAVVAMYQQGGHSLREVAAAADGLLSHETIRKLTAAAPQPDPATAAPAVTEVRAGDLRRGDTFHELGMPPATIHKIGFHGSTVLLWTDDGTEASLDRDAVVTLVTPGMRPRPSARGRRQKGV
jgi:hypothetical protein